MRKKLAVFIGEIAGDYQEKITKVITHHANSLDYDVVIICSYGSYNDNILCAEGEMASIHLPDCSVFDGIIVTEDVFDNPGMDNELYEILKRDATCPVIYLRTEREGCYSILLENTASVENMVRHFTDVHGFRDICYMSGKEGTLDTTERLQGYLNVMRENNIPVTDHMIFHGNYWRNKGEEAVNWFMEGRETYPQAIVCANDYMALSICDELRKRGVKVPEDVCVSGFDFIPEAQIYEPTLTSLEVDFEGMAIRAVDLIDQINNGEQVNQIQRIQAKSRFRRSCGCGEQYKFEHVVKLLEDSYRHTNDTKDIILCTMDYQDSFDFDEYMAVAGKYRQFIRSDKAFFCFNDSEEKGVDEVENDSLFTEQMILRSIMYVEGSWKTDMLNTSFPRRSLLPDEYWEGDEPHNYFFFTIHFKNIVFGYMVTTMPTKSWFDIYTQDYLMSLANAIENGNVHKRMAKLEEIKSLYQKDPLTGIYNRRGFDKLLKNSYYTARMHGDNIGIVSIDMDSFKSINDTYGHAEGDNALKIVAQTLQGVMDEGEYCARVGGDEFAAVILITSPNSAENFRLKFYEALKMQNEQIERYNVGASMGICEIAEDMSASLIACLQTADMRMYETKRSKKNKQV